MNCAICKRTGLTERELVVHNKYFHNRVSSSMQPAQEIVNGVCPDCGSTIWFEEGCATCHSCGFNKCG